MMECWVGLPAEQLGGGIFGMIGPSMRRRRSRASQSALRFYNLRFESLWEKLSYRSADGSDRSTDGSDRRQSLRSASDPTLMPESGIEPTPGSIPPAKLQQNCQQPVDFDCSYVQQGGR